MPKIKFWYTADKVEDTFIKVCLSDIIDIIFCAFCDQYDIRYDWTNRKLNNMPSSSTLIKPDYVITIQPMLDIKFDLLTTEIKPPGKNKVSNDFIKLSLQLNLMVNSLVKFGVDNPVVCALLVEGYDCYTYTTKIGDNEAVYPMVQRAFFRLPRDMTDIPLLVTAIEALSHLKHFMRATMEKIREKSDEDSINMDMVRQAFCWIKSDTPEVTPSSS